MIPARSRPCGTLSLQLPFFLVVALLWLGMPGAAAGDTIPPAPSLDSEMVVVPAAQLDRVERLLAVYRRIPGLLNVHLTVEGGIVEIRGTALSAEDRELALAHARQLLPDVDYLDARGLVVETDLRKRLDPAVERIREKGMAFLRFLPSLLLGFAILGLGAALAGWLGSRSLLYDRVARNPFVRNLMRQSVRAVVFLTALLLALDLMGVTALVGAVLGAAGVAGIAVGFAFRDIVENYLAGVLLSLRQPFAPNDHVILAGEEGRVARLTGRETVLMTLDGNHVRIPNATVFKAVITNLTRNPRRRFGFSVGIAPWENLGVALPIARDAVAGLTGVLETPRVAVRVQELQDSSVILRVTGWVNQSEVDFGKVQSQARRAVKEAFEREGVAPPPSEFGIRILENQIDGTLSMPLSMPGSMPGAGPSGPSPQSEIMEAGEMPETIEDLSPDTTIEEEIARELQDETQENLLQPLPSPKPYRDSSPDPAAGSPESGSTGSVPG